MKFSLFYFPQLGGGDPESYERKSPPFDPEKMQFQPEREKEIAAAFGEAMTPR